MATAAGTSASATTAHLHHLRDAGLVEVEAAGRRRLHRLSSAAVAHAIEALAEISPLLPEPVTSHPVRRGIKTKLRYARTCYSHLGGALGVRITDVLHETESSI